MITGMLGKAKGQILHVAACLQMFFDDSATINEEMDEETEQWRLNKLKSFQH